MLHSNQLMKRVFISLLFLSYILNTLYGQGGNLLDTSTIDPSTVLWYKKPASVWEEALPVGNGRLGAMVFGKNDQERIQLNEETYWSGGPYSTVVKGGYKVLPEIQKAE